MHVVLIGGAGFIGHNLAIKLRAENHQVTIIDSLMVNNLYSIDQKTTPETQAILQDRLMRLDVAGVPVLRIDATDYHMLSRAIAPLKPDAIVHLAAVAHLDRSIKDPYNTITNSLHTLENALDVARNTKSNPHFVYFSSSTVYGNFSGSVTEKSPCNTTSIYGAVKLAGEKIVQAYHHTFGMDTTIIRPSALYGPRCISGRVTQKFLEQAVNGGPITIHGDGEIYQDFTYIDDLVQGVIRVLNRRSQASGETFNLTASQGRCLNELADIICQHFQVPVTHIEKDPHKPERGTLSVERARNFIGYEPKFRLEDGIAEYVLWYQHFRKQFLQRKSS